MLFPEWVDNPKDQSDEERACKRLRFLIRRAAILVSPECTVGGLCTRHGLSSTAVQKALSVGSFSPALAAQVELAVGREILRREHLLYPLEIENK